MNFLWTFHIFYRAHKKNRYAVLWNATRSNREKPAKDQRVRRLNKSRGSHGGFDWGLRNLTGIDGVKGGNDWGCGGRDCIWDFWEQSGPQDENAGEGGWQFRLFERSELRNCRRSQCLRGARKSCLKDSHADVYTRALSPWYPCSIPAVFLFVLFPYISRF